MWCCVADTTASRKITSAKMDQLAQLAISNKSDSRYAKQLLSMAKSQHDFTACRATNTLGRLGEAALPIITDIAALMNSPNGCVSQEAAKALKRLGPLSEAVLPQLRERIEREPSDATTWFAVQALGEIGQPAMECLPLLRAKAGSEPEMFKGTVLHAIQKIEHDISRHRPAS
jgi:HEAT repeat protein